MHTKVFSVQIFHYFCQIPPRVCTLVLFIFKCFFHSFIYYRKATIFSELLNLAKLAMTHETLNLLALKVRSKVTLYSSKSIQVTRCSSTIHQNAK